MMKIRLLRGTAVLMAAGLAACLSSLPAAAKAKSASVPAGITLTKSGLVTDKDTLAKAMEEAAAGSSTSKSSKADQTVLNSLTVLDADDLYYTRKDAGTCLIVTEASGSVRFHNVKIGDPRSIVEGKLGAAFSLTYAAKDTAGIDLYQDAEDDSCILWFQYGADDTVRAIVYQKDPAKQ